MTDPFGRPIQRHMVEVHGTHPRLVARPERAEVLHGRLYPACKGDGCWGCRL